MEREDVLPPVGTLDEESRVAFLNRVYVHLFGAIVGFTLIEMVLFMSGLALPIVKAMIGTSWLLVLGGFMVVGWIASHVAHRTESLGAQYAALTAYVLAEAILFLPLLFLAQIAARGSVIESAALVTLLAFGGLTAIVLTSRADFSFLGAFLKFAFLLALVLIVAAAAFGLNLGTFFSVAMVALAGAAILFDTSNVLHRYPEDRYVGAALELFASVALMFWYVLRLFISLQRD
jgi:FtsH-binding integral membrane protein